MHFQIRNIRFAECVLQENSDTCVDTKLRGIDATCIVSGDGMTLHSQYKQQGYSNFHVYVLKTKLTMELNHKLSKSTLLFLQVIFKYPHSYSKQHAYVQNHWELACFS